MIMIKFLIAAAFSTFSTATNSTLSHNCKSHPDGLIETYKSHCNWVHDWLADIPNDNCIIENSSSHTPEEIHDYMQENEDKCCDSGLGFCEPQVVGPRNPMKSLQDDAVFKGYGCWCSASTYFAFGKGQPVDELDKICKNVVENYRCIKHDTANENGDCPRNFHDYNVPLSLYLSQDQLMDRCADIQDEDLSDERKICAKRRCLVDSTVFHFMLNNFSPTGFQFDTGMIWKEFGGSFDPAVECLNAGNYEEDKSCCGEYPKRLPHNPHHTGCCSGIKYGLDSHECCISGVSEEITKIDTCAGTTVPWNY